MAKTIQNVLIYGYGVMGQGVAKTFAEAGFTTVIRSARAASLKDLPPGVPPAQACRCRHPIW